MTDAKDITGSGRPKDAPRRAASWNVCGSTRHTSSRTRPRPHTKAAFLQDDVPTAVKKRRHAELPELQKGISCGERNAKKAGG